jgi:hypothetical protein
LHFETDLMAEVEPARVDPAVRAPQLQPEAVAGGGAILKALSPWDARTGAFSVWRALLLQDIVILVPLMIGLFLVPTTFFTVASKTLTFLQVPPLSWWLPSGKGLEVAPLLLKTIASIGLGFALFLTRILMRNDIATARDVGVYHLAMGVLMSWAVFQLGSLPAKSLLGFFTVHDFAAGIGLLAFTPGSAKLQQALGRATGTGGVA